jgi:hypothetical protein
MTTLLEASSTLNLKPQKLTLSVFRFGLAQIYVVRFVSAYVLLGFVVMEVCYFGVWCRPFNNYWKVPVDNSMCNETIYRVWSNKHQYNVRLQPTILS